MFCVDETDELVTAGPEYHQVKSDLEHVKPNETLHIEK